VLAIVAWNRSQAVPAVWGASASALLQACFAATETNLLQHAQSVTALTCSPDGRQTVRGSSDGTHRRWIASTQEWYRLACARLTNHPLLRDPASVPTDQEVIAAGKQVAQACQTLVLFSYGLMTWARRLVGR
jgi:hypothetical protein